MVCVLSLNTKFRLFKLQLFTQDDEEEIGQEFLQRRRRPSQNDNKSEMQRHTGQIQLQQRARERGENKNPPKWEQCWQTCEINRENEWACPQSARESKSGGASAKDRQFILLLLTCAQNIYINWLHIFLFFYHHPLFYIHPGKWITLPQPNCLYIIYQSILGACQIWSDASRTQTHTWAHTFTDQHSRIHTHAPGCLFCFCLRLFFLSICDLFSQPQIWLWFTADWKCKQCCRTISIRLAVLKYFSYFIAVGYSHLSLFEKFTYYKHAVLGLLLLTREHLVWPQLDRSNIPLRSALRNTLQ